MKVINPTDKKITIKYLGTEYSVDADSSVSNVPEEAAMYWKNALHPFLMVEEDSVEPVKVKTQTEEPKEDVKVEEKVTKTKK